jgi:hypothetical protein
MSLLLAVPSRITITGDGAPTIAEFIAAGAGAIGTAGSGAVLIDPFTSDGTGSAGSVSQYGLGGETHVALFIGGGLSIDGYLHKRTH